eukprot:1948734-Pleurochrysis_carterae.AAC.3
MALTFRKRRPHCLNYLLVILSCLLRDTAQHLLQAKTFSEWVTEAADSPISHCQSRSFSKALCIASRLEMEGKP